jgi:hypothetical protein
MANLSTRELFTRLRDKFTMNADAEWIQCFDDAVAETLYDLVDGATADPPKRRRGRKPRLPEDHSAQKES